MTMLAPERSYPEGYRGFTQPIQTNIGLILYLKVGHIRFLQDSFNFTSHSDPNTIQHYIIHTSVKCSNE
jgi:hypothetical protein